VKFVSQVYLNGTKVGGHHGGWEPFEAEINGVCRADRPNDLLVRVQDCTGVIDQPMDYGKRGHGVRFLSQAKDAVMAPVGSQYATMGIWEPVKRPRGLSPRVAGLADVFILRGTSGRSDGPFELCEAASGGLHRRPVSDSM
jgi:hypothetical protein